MRRDRIFTLLILVVACGVAHAYTDINSNYVDGTWTLSGSPYLVHVNVEIEDTHTLVIEPGVDVIFDYFCGLTANGCLTAIGTEQDSIRFSAAEQPWSGIRIFGTNWDVDSTKVEFCVITGSNGGGIFMDTAFRVGIRHCRISDNTSSYGAGIYILGSTPNVTDNLIKDNYAIGNGGGIYVQDNSTPLIARNVIINNQCNDSGGGIGVDSCIPLIYGNTIQGNTASFVGGGIFLFNSSSSIFNNFILNNTGEMGGGIGVWSGCGPHISGNVICNNTGYYGGGLYSYNFNGIWWVNNTVSENYASVGGAMCLDNNIDLYAFNSILWGNLAQSCNEVSIGTFCTPGFTNCCIEGGYDYFGGIGFGDYDISPNVNLLTANPLFTNPTAGAGALYYTPAEGWKLGENSPCIDAGVMTDDLYLLYYDVFGSPRVLGAGVDIGAGEWDPNPSDLAAETMYPSGQALSNYPNPFNPETTISYTLQKDSRVTLDIYNSHGQLVRTLFDGTTGKGTHALKWDGKTDSGREVSSGFYIYRLKTVSQIISRKMLLIK
jgi:parallel beta-helix repeat protein